MAAEQGDADSQLNLGSMYAKGDGVQQDKRKAFELYEKAAKQNNPKAQFNLGFMYSKGDGVEKNSRKAAEYYQKAADQNIPQASFNLGVLYFKGVDGVPEDKAKAAKLFEKTVKLNPTNSKAIFNLAVMYQKGEGVEKDEKRLLNFMKKVLNLLMVMLFSTSVSCMKKEVEVLLKIKKKLLNITNVLLVLVMQKHALT